MASNIDITKPNAGAALTADVRTNFGFAKDEINDLNRIGEDSVTSTGTDTIEVTYANVPTSLTVGQLFGFRAGGSNTGAATFNCGFGGAIDLAIQSGAPPYFPANSIISGGQYIVKYDGTEYILLNPSPSLKLDKIGGTMSGNIDMGGNDISNISDGGAADDPMAIGQGITTLNVTGSPLRVVAMGRINAAGSTGSGSASLYDGYNCTMAHPLQGTYTVGISTDATTANSMVVQVTSNALDMSAVAHTIATTGFTINIFNSSTLGSFNYDCSFIVYEIL